MEAHLNCIATATPPHECQDAFVRSLPDWISDPAMAGKLQFIARRSGIARRHTVLDPLLGPPGSGAFYEYGRFPSTAHRMQAYQQAALPLALDACRRLPARARLRHVSHLVITSCTGFYAPGLDIDLIQALHLPPHTQRTVIGFMGCYAAITGLRAARDIVAHDPDARVLLINLELCSLHLQADAPFDRLLSFLLFADGCAASLISAEPAGLRLDGFHSFLSLADRDRMSWRIDDQGFAMTLDAQVPARIRQFFRGDAPALDRMASEAAEAAWAIHPGGRAILDAVEGAFALTPEQMAPSRQVLHRYGNMSSATVMFVLEDLLRPGRMEAGQPGHAVAFGPGLTLESLRFTRHPDPAEPLPRERETDTAFLAAAI